MLVKLALRNVRRSAKDYAVYFVTLAFGVAVFYAFNSIGSQTILFDIKSHAAGRMLNKTTYFLGLFSVVVALILAFLVVYANRFIIKRRKREFGTYLLLGMGASKMATVLLVEMLAVGTISLIVGLGAGLLLSQGLAFCTAAIMGTTMTRYTFVVSPDAILKTLACFAVLFAATLAMNIVFVARRKLADLLTARSESSRQSRIPLGVRVMGFALSLALLAVAYRMLSENQFSEMNSEFAGCTVLMVMGTFLLFWSGSTIALALVRRASSFFLTGLNAFTTRQVSSKIGTAFASLSVVCIMLFFALSTVSIGCGVRAIFVGDIEQTTRYDATMVADLVQPVNPSLRDELPDTYDNRIALAEEASPGLLAAAQAANFDMAAALAERCPAWSDLVAASAQIDYYQIPQMTWGAVLEEANVDSSSMDSYQLFNTSDVSIMGLSQFNAVRALIGLSSCQLADDQYMVNNTLDLSETVAGLMREQAAPITIVGTELTCAPDELAIEVRNSAASGVGLELIVPDSVIEALKEQGALPVWSYMDIMYTCERAEGDIQLRQILLDAYQPGGTLDEDYYPAPVGHWPYTQVYTADEMATQAGGLKLLVTYLALYIGFVLLVSTAAILAIQQLSEAADSVGRYERLSSLGCDEDMILRSLRTQGVLYFLVPLAVALVHAAYAVHVMNVGLFSAFGIDPMEGIAITGGLVVVIYGCYMLVTYLASRNVVREACGF